jgi:tape measure domain-containing protein
MATDIEKLVVQMSAEFRDFNKQFAAANGVAFKQFNAIQKKARETDKVLNSIGQNMARNLAMPISGIGAALGVRELIRLTDTWTDLNGRVRIATGSQEAATETMGRLSDIARRTYSSFELTTESFLGNAQALKELGYTTTQQLDYTEALNNALVVSGAKGERAQQVQDALSKAMALGTLRGKELNTVISTGGRVAQALAAGLGVSTNALRKLGEEGKLTSSKVFKSLTSQSETLRREADGMQATIADAAQLARNSFLEYVGGMDQAAGASAKIAQAIILVADNMDTVANATLIAAEVIIGALAGRAMFQAIGTVGSVAVALKKFIEIARTAQGLTGLGAAFASLGAAANPIALIVGGAAALAVGHFASQAMEAEARTKLYNATLVRLGIVAKDAAEGVNEAAAAQERLNTAKGIAEFKQETEAAKEKLGQFTHEVEDFLEVWDALAAHGNETAAELATLYRKMLDGKIPADRLKDALDQLAKKQPEWARQIAELQDLAAEYYNAARAAGLLAAEQAKQGVPKPEDFGGKADFVQFAGQRAEGQKWLSEQERRNALTKEQRDLEDEIARIRKDMPSGAFLSDSQVSILAQHNLATKAGDKKGHKTQSPGEKYVDAFFQTSGSLADLQQQIALQKTLNPLVNDYGFTMEKLRVQQELRNAATKAGLTLDPAQNAAIDALATEYATATVEAAKLTEAQGAARQSMEDWFALGKSATRGFIDDLVAGKSAVEALGNAFAKLGDKLLDLGLNSLFGTGSGSKPFGLLGDMLGFADGGYTGPGGRNQPAGVVHRGEVVWSQKDVAKAGGPSVVDAMRRGLAGYANGGVVNMRMPVLPKIPQMAGQGSSGPRFEMPIHIDARGADEAAIARLERGIGRMQAEFEGRVRKIVRERPQKGW